MNDDVAGCISLDRDARIKKLLRCKQLIVSTIIQQSEQLKCVHSTGKVPLQTLLNASSTFSYAARPPKDWQIGTPLLNYHPPAPQPEEMRKSVLQSFTYQNHISIAPRSSSSHGKGFDIVSTLEHDRFLQSSKEKILRYLNSDGADNALVLGADANARDETLAVISSSANSAALLKSESNPTRAVQISFGGNYDEDESSEEEPDF